MAENEDFHELMRLAVCSELRKNIMVYLNDGEKSLKEMREEMNVSSTTAIHALKDLEKSNLTFQDQDKKYALTNIGKIMALKLVDFSDASLVLKKHEKFWLEHDMSGIPVHLMRKIGWLEDSVLFTDTEIDIFKVHSNFINLLKDAKEIKGVSPIFVPEFASLFEELVITKNINVSLIIKKDVLDKISSEIKQKILDINNNPGLNLYVIEDDIKIAFTVTDYFMSLGFFRQDGVYDYSNDLINYNEKGIAWGNELFEYYRRAAKII
ncbi:MAG: winged helix-turn-helix domain-containing protein [Candidatus Methanoperedenaceae archaeon]|nr:winged helix-turn-helix domain-containing protein [Candidatus Methanoperedenaceae archaeon]